MATDKRARKKDARDTALAERQALLRRRRMARLGAVATVIALIAAVAIVASGGNDDKPERRNDPAAGAPEEASEPPESEPPAEAGPVACGAEAPPPPTARQDYPEAAQVLEEGVDYRAAMETSCGTLEIDLLEENAPITVNNFVFLAQEGYYDGLTFHRIEKEFVIQGGDPMGSGQGGPGYAFEDELWAPSKEYKFGTMAMANSGPDTNGSQFFFIVHKPTKQPAALAPAYSVFGKVAKSTWPTLEKIRKVEVQTSMPLSTVYIESVEIVEGGAR